MNWLKHLPVFKHRSLAKDPHDSFAIRGGLALIRNKPGLPAPGAAIDEIELPSQLIFPLLDYHQRVLTPRVSVGDQVFIGDWLAPGVLCSANGVVSAIEDKHFIHPSHRRSPCVVVDTCDTDKVSLSIEQTQLSAVSSTTHEKVHRANITGLGGAGFSTSDKLIAVDTSGSGVSLLIINAVECEPMISCDEALLISRATDVINAIHQMIDITACTRCVLAIENDKAEALQQLRTALERYEPPANSAVNIQLVLLSPIYPSGAETVLIRRITGHTLPTGTRAADEGILCLNVATTLAAAEAQFGYPLISRIVSVHNLTSQQSTNVRVRFGTAVRHVLAMTGNSLENNASGIAPRIRAGGPLSGFELARADVPVTATTNCITLDYVKIDDEVGADASASAPAGAPAAACIRCSRCSDVCPVNLLPQQLHWYCDKDDIDGAMRYGLDACIECGCCDVVCPSTIALTAGFRHGKSLWREQQLATQEADISRVRFEQREQRLEHRKLAAARIRKEKAEQLQLSDSEYDPIAAALARSRARREKR